MIIFLLAYIGGVLTILSPCILPVLPFVFARAGQPFIRSTLPMLTGMALMFAVVATLAAVGGSWAVHANQYGRNAAIILLALFGLSLIVPQVADRIMHPVLALGQRLLSSAESRQNGATGGVHSPLITSFLLGIATGLLWAPCAGPILGLLLTGAALNGANVHTSLLLFAYALGAASSLGAALLIGGRVFAAMKQSLGAGEWIRRGLGVAVLIGVGAIASGLDTGLLTNLSLAHTARIEQALLDRTTGPSTPATMANVTNTASPTLNSGSPINLPVEGTLPSLDGAIQWLNSPPLTVAGLQGKVVLVDFWTYSCINCLRTLPYVKTWAEKYKDQGLVVIGVHTPEFAFEKDIGNVSRAVHDLGITYPVAIDSNNAIWRAFNNQYWPAHYFIDAQGRIRAHHFGEGEYNQSEQIIRQLLTEAGQKVMPQTNVKGDVGTGVSMASDNVDVQSGETYIGYARAKNFVSDGGVTEDIARVYSIPNPLQLNQWGLKGNWRVEPEKAVLMDPAGHLSFRFHARDLHLVMGLGKDGKPVHFIVRLDGQPLGADHGVDSNEAGYGTVTEERLYQLIRKTGPVQDHTFDIIFLDPGVKVYSFTFG